MNRKTHIYMKWVSGFYTVTFIYHRRDYNGNACWKMLSLVVAALSSLFDGYL